MRIDRYLPSQHPLSKVYRLGAALFGTGLVVFGALGWTQQITFVSTAGVRVWGLSTNGLLSVISLAVGVVLIAAAAWGGWVASTTTATIGILFLLSGLVNLALLETSWNLLAFKMSNVIFSLIAGMLLLFFGFYGRVSGGLPEDNPFVRYRHHEPAQGSPLAPPARLDQDELLRAEVAFAEGHPSPHQDRLVREDLTDHSRAERERAYAHYRQNHPEEQQATEQS